MSSRGRVSRYLAAIYGSRIAPRLSEQIEALHRKYEAAIPHGQAVSLTERDALLITYPDQVQTPGVPPLTALAAFCASHVKDLVTGIHVLPFFPSSSDDGFSVMDYREVDPAYGSWEEIGKLEQHYRLMFDAVINHVSAESAWFQACLRGEPPYREYFIRVAETADLSNVVRPRAQPLLTHFQDLPGTGAAWTTFGPDQIDLNYGNPEVLLEVLDLLLYYVSQGHHCYVLMPSRTYGRKSVPVAFIARKRT
jgi:hypothetical protein